MKRAQRRAHTERIVRRRKREAYWSEWSPSDAGRARNLSPFDCGKPQCYACTHRRPNYEKRIDRNA